MLIIEEKIYKFDCGSEERKNNWINCINKELKKIKDKAEKRVENIYQVKLRKKFITDHLKNPNVKSDINQINSNIISIIHLEPQFFKEKRKNMEENQPVDTEFSFKDKSSSQGLNLDFGFISNKKKSSNIFSCCSKCFNTFIKKKKIL